MKLTSLLTRKPSADLPGVKGAVIIDNNTDALIERINPEMDNIIAVIDDIDLDRATADLLVEKNVKAVINASPFISGRFPNQGPEVLALAGITLVDNVGSNIFSKLRDGSYVRIHEGVVYLNGKIISEGKELTEVHIVEKIIAAKSAVVDHLEAFASNSIEFIRSESQLLIDEIGIPFIDVDLKGKHVVVVSAEQDYKEDLKRLKPFIKEYNPVMIGVDNGADAILKAGYTLDIIVGNPDNISTNSLKAARSVVLPATPEGRAPGLRRIQDIGIGAVTFPASCTASDLALILADHGDASLIVTVGQRATLQDFFDSKRASSQPSTFLTRLKVGHKLVDAKAVNTLYRNHLSLWSVSILVLIAIASIVAVLVVTGVLSPIQDWIIHETRNISDYWTEIINKFNK